MPLYIHRQWDEFAKNISVEDHAIYSILHRSRLDPGRLIEIRKIAKNKHHQDVLDNRELSRDVLNDVENFFSQVAGLDPEWNFSFSSKVLLAIPQYHDIQQLFQVSRYVTLYPDRQVFLLVKDKHLFQLARGLLAGQSIIAGHAFLGWRAWIRLARTFLRVIINRPSGQTAKFLLCSLATKSPTVYGDAYFGTLAQDLEKSGSVMTVYLKSGRELRLPKNRSFEPLECYASIADVLAAWVETVTACFQKPAPVLMINGRNFSSLITFLRRTEIRSGEYFMLQFMRRAYARMLRTIDPDTLIYPFENRSWEKNLLAVAAKERGTVRIGYQHSSITPRHLAFNIQRDELAMNYLPDKVVAVGEITAGWLKNAAPDLGGRICVGGSFRRVQQAIPDTLGHAVLVAISSSRDEAWSLLCMVHEASSLTSARFIIRSHPTISIDDMYASFDWAVNVELSLGRSLAEDIGRSSIVAYSSSTVVIEGMLFGRIPLYLDIGDIPCGDPLLGSCSTKLVALTGVEFAERIEQVARQGQDTQNDNKRLSIGYAEKYLPAKSSSVFTGQ